MNSYRFCTHGNVRHLVTSITTTWLAAFVLLVLSACQKETTDIDSGSVGLLAQDWLEALNENSAIFAPPATPKLPDDLFIHSDTRTETFSLQVVLRASSTADKKPISENWRTGINARIDKIALGSADSELVGSLWQFSKILRSSVFADSLAVDADSEESLSSDEMPFGQLQSSDLAVISNNLARSERSQHVQRASLGLAGSNDQSIWVLDNKLTSQIRTGSGSTCSRRYRWEFVLTATELADLDIVFEQCPKVLSLGSFNRWQQSSTTVTGTVTSSIQDAAPIAIEVSGVAWMSQIWGNLPTADGAVVLDSVQVRLDDSQWLDVSRSKRRSGRGPKTVSASLGNDAGLAEDIIVSWHDSTELVTANSGNSYPRSIMLEKGDGQMILKIKPFNRYDEAMDIGGSVLQVPVTVEGTHTGTGFMTYTHINSQ